MLIKLLKKHEISFTIILGFLCFIVALIFFGNEFPGKNILFYGYNNPTNLQIKNENLYLHTGNQYRLTTFVEVRGKPIHIEPILALKIEQSNNIEIDKKFYLVKVEDIDHITIFGGLMIMDFFHPNHLVILIFQLRQINYPKNLIPLK